MAAAEHRALVEVLRVGLADKDSIPNANPPVVILGDMAQVCIVLYVASAASSTTTVVAGTDTLLWSRNGSNQTWETHFPSTNSISSLWLD